MALFNCQATHVLNETGLNNQKTTNEMKISLYSVERVNSLCQLNHVTIKSTLLLNSLNNFFKCHGVVVYDFKEQC